MELIIGGSCQGKRAFAKKEFPDVRFLEGNLCTLEELLACEGVFDFHLFIQKEMKESRLPENLAELILERNPNLIVVGDEVGYGVVPMDVFERAYREKVGRICTELAAEAKKVTRVICGIGMVIKND